MVRGTQDFEGAVRRSARAVPDACRPIGVSTSRPSPAHGMLIWQTQSQVISLGEYAMKKLVVVFAIAMAMVGFVGARTGVGAEQTWTGVVTDSQCGGDHGGEVDERECTLKCTARGLKFALAVDHGAKVLAIDNQAFAGLREHAGHTVKITGEQRGDAIVISKIEMPRKS
jgi:hypothetical protein